MPGTPNYGSNPQNDKTYQKQLSTLLDVAFYVDRKLIPKTVRSTIIMLLHKEHAAISSKMTTTVKAFLSSRIAKRIRQKGDKGILWKSAGMDNKAQIPMADNY